MAKPISALDDEALAWLVKLNSGHLSLSEEQAFSHGYTAQLHTKRRT